MTRSAAPEPAAPPLVLRCPVVAITRTQPPPVSITARTPAAVTVAWPRVRVAGDRLVGGEFSPLAAFTSPPAPRVIRLAAPPRGPWRVPLPPALRDMLARPLPARAD